MGRTNYIFVDFENVQETDVDRVAGKNVKIFFVLGVRHKSLPTKLTMKLLKFASQVEIVETGQNGKNALDLVLAYHVGVTAKADPQGYFHFISKDKDFDALISHLKSSGKLAGRHVSFAETPILMNLVERVKFVKEHFTNVSNGFPKKKAALISQLQHLFGKELSTEEVEATIVELQKAKLLKISDAGAVTYPSPKPANHSPHSS